MPSAIAAMTIMCIIEAVEAIGDLTSTACGGMDREPSEQEISGGIAGFIPKAASVLNTILPKDHEEEE